MTWRVHFNFALLLPLSLSLSLSIENKWSRRDQSPSKLTTTFIRFEIESPRQILSRINTAWRRKLSNALFILLLEERDFRLSTKKKKCDNAYHFYEYFTLKRHQFWSTPFRFAGNERQFPSMNVWRRWKGNLLLSQNQRSQLFHRKPNDEPLDSIHRTESEEFKVKRVWTNVNWLGEFMNCGFRFYGEEEFNSPSAVFLGVRNNISFGRGSRWISHPKECVRSGSIVSKSFDEERWLVDRKNCSLK